MAASVKCPRCNVRNQPAAQFCGRCGQPLVDGAQRADASGEGMFGQGTARFAEQGTLDTASRPNGQAVRSTGAVRHPDPLSAPEDFRACEEVPDLYYRWEAAWGGTMLVGTETIAVIVFNGGYPLEEVVLKIRGLGVDGEEIFSIEETVDELPRGKKVTIEVPSYELPAPASDIAVTLLSGSYGSHT